MRAKRRMHRNLGLSIAVMTILAIWFFKISYQAFDRYKLDCKVYWKSPNNLPLADAPHWVYYAFDTLYTSRSITADEKVVLLSLVKRDTVNYPTYSKAIDELAFKSNFTTKVSFMIILILAGASGIIGVQIRTIFDFIGRVAFKNGVVYTKWWPWYFLRPILGFIVACIVIVFFESGILNTLKNYNHTGAMLIGVSVLSGFAAFDVVVAMRKISKRIFGAENDK